MVGDTKKKQRRRRKLNNQVEKLINNEVPR